MKYLILPAFALLAVACTNEPVTEVPVVGTTHVSMDSDYKQVVNNTGDTLFVKYSQDGESAIIHYKGEVHTLKTDVTGSGSRYTGDDYELREWQGQTFLNYDDKPIFEAGDKQM